MIPYPSVLEFFVSFYNILPVSFREFISLAILLPLAVYFLIWLVGQILG